MQNATRPTPAAGPLLSCDTAEEQAAYTRAVGSGLASQQVRRRFDARPGVTAAAVRAEMMSPDTVGRALGHTASTLAAYRRAVGSLSHARGELGRLRSVVGADVRSVPFVVCLPVVLTGMGYVKLFSSLSFWVEEAAFLGLGIAVAVLFLLTYSDPRSPENLKNQLGLVWYTLCLPFDLLDVRRAAKHWEDDLRVNGTPRAALSVIEALMGSDPHSVLLPGRFDGLRSATSTEWVVPGEASRQLERKLSALDGGTIAVCGPRGAGKTTLLRNAAGKNDFVVTIRVPAAYTPYDLVLSAFIKVCEHFVAREGYEPPQLNRLSGFVRTHQRVRHTLRGLRRRVFFGVPAAALIALGTAAAARALWDKHSTGVWSWADTAGHWVVTHAEGIWEGRSVGTGLAVTVAGLLVWQVRKSGRWRRRLLAAPAALVRLVAICLILAPLASLPFDPDVRRHFLSLIDPNAGWLLLLLLLALSLVSFIRGAMSTGPVSERLWKLGSVIALLSAVAVILRNAHVQSILVDSENPARLAYIIAGTLLLRVGSWRTKREEPPLVTRCRDHLYQLKTVQTTSATLNIGLAQTAALGSAHSSSLASTPPNFPQLVDDLRDLLASIADHVHAQRSRTIICIDELDRLGSDKQALLFLSEIKAILGVPQVHYLISVAEDVGAAFVRRGLPHRDATDSSLDDIVHVQPGDLAQSVAIMDKRAGDDLPGPYVLLAHALAGGIPRDLIRYGRRILEMHEDISLTRQAPGVELTEISRRLIVEELSDTLAGFRTLLAKQQWTRENATWLSTYRIVMDHLRHACPHSTNDLVVALGHLASGVLPASGPAAEPSEAARQLITEASAYTYYALTLLQIFHPDDFEDRRIRAIGTAAGEPQFLAEARLELAVSPHSARPLIDAARAAWHLPPAPAGIPAARTQPCPSPVCS